MSFERSINKELRQFGIHTNGNQMFRIAWSDEQYEVRQGTFSEFSDGGIFLREFTGIKRVKKYYNIRHKWILEMYIPPEQCQFPDLPVARVEGTYEPLYVFQDAHGNELPFNVDICRQIISALFIPRTKGEIKAAMQKLEDKDDEDFEKWSHDFIGGEHSDIADRLKNHEGVFIDGSKVKGA